MRKHAWCLTWFQTTGTTALTDFPLPAQFITLDGEECTYVVYQCERGVNLDKRAHIQIYIEYENQKSGAYMMKHFVGAHIERRIKTAKQASDYCQKLETRIDGPARMRGTISHQVRW